jgi:hypothetical protein
VTPVGYTGLPVTSLSSGLADQLKTKGLTTAAGHYDQALSALHEQNWASSNSQLRTTSESVLLELSLARPGSAVTGGGAAIDALQKNGDLPYGPK